MMDLEFWIPSWLQLTLALSGIVLTLYHHYLTSTFNHWRDKGVKFIKPYPIAGSLWSVLTIREHIMNFTQRVSKQYSGEPYVGYFQGPRPSLIILDPEIIKNIIIKDFSHFVDHGFMFDEKADPMEAKNLYNMEGHKWKEMRTKLTPTFTSGRMKEMFPLVLECAVKFEHHLAGLANTGEEFEAKDLLSRYTTDVIGSCAFGIKCNSLDHPDCEFRVMGRRLIESDVWRAIKGFIMVFVPDLGQKLGFAFIDAVTTDFFRCLVRDVIAKRARTGEVRRDFMQLLIELKENGRLPDGFEEEELANPENGELYANFPQSSNVIKWTHDDVTAQAVVFFLAGFETSSSVMSLALLELAVNPDVQRRAQHEIDEVLQRHEGMITYQALQEMIYIDWVLKEALRKYPSVSSISRQCTKNYIIPSTQLAIDKDVMITIPVHALQNDPQYFPEPDRFKPERFSEEQFDDKCKSVYMPFGAGPRVCIGHRFASMLTKLGLIFLLRKFDVITCSRTKFPPIFDPKQIILNTKTGVWLKVAHRQ